MADGCKWIDGEPGEVLFRGEDIYCGAPVSRPGSAWCPVHRAICYPPGAMWGIEQVNPAAAGKPAELGRGGAAATPAMPERIAA